MFEKERRKNDKMQSFKLTDSLFSGLSLSVAYLQLKFRTEQGEAIVLFTRHGRIGREALRSPRLSRSLPGSKNRPLHAK